MNISIDDTIIESTATYDGQKLDVNELLVCMIIMMEENPTDIVKR